MSIRFGPTSEIAKSLSDGRTFHREEQLWRDNLRRTGRELWSQLTRQWYGAPPYIPRSPQAPAIFCESLSTDGQWYPSEVLGWPESEEIVIVKILGYENPAEVWKAHIDNVRPLPLPSPTWCKRQGFASTRLCIYNAILV